MKASFFRRFLIIVSVMVGILILLPVLQFGEKAEGFFRKAGGISVSGTYASASDGGKRVARILLRTAAADFPLDNVTLMGPNAAAGRLAALSWKSDASSATVLFENGVSVTLSDAGNSGVHLKVSALSRPDATLRVPIRFRGSIKEDPNRKGMVAISTPSGSLSLVLPAGASLGAGNSYISLSSKDSLYPRVSILKPEKEGAIAVSLANQTPTDPAVFKAGIRAWVGKAYDGWNGSRYDAAQGGWYFGEGDIRFTEKTLVAYLAESIQRGTYAAAREKIGDALVSHGEKLGWLSSVYLGGTVAKSRAMDAETKEAVAEITAKIEAKDPTLFERERFVQFILDRAPYSLAKQAFAFAAELESAGITTKTALGILGCMTESKTLFAQDETNPFENMESLVERRLIPGIQKTQEGFFLVTEGDKCDTYDSLLAGTLLVKYGELTQRDVYTGIGQSLVNGVLSIADARGFVPKFLSIQGGSTVKREGLYSPETLYPLVADNPYYPRAVSFYQYAGPGTWALTSSRTLYIRNESATIAFSSAFPAGFSHYIVFRGIKPFARLKLYGIDFRTDPQFEVYDSSGWFYRTESQTLFVKMRHKSDTEEVLLAF